MKVRKSTMLAIAIIVVPALLYAAGGAGETAEAERPSITVMVNSGATAAHFPASNDLAAYQAREEMSGIHVEWDVVETANFNEVVSARLAAGVNLPDVMDLSKELFENARKGGLLLPMNDLLADHAPNLVKWFAEEENQIFMAAWSSPDGHLYGINDKVLPNNLSLNIMFNTLWLERLGLETPATTDEFVEVLKAFRDQDANGNGKTDDEIPFVANQGALLFLGNSFGLRGSTRGAPYNFENGKVTWNYVDTRYKALLEYCNMLWNEGLIDPEFATLNYNTMLERTANDLSGAVYFWSTWAFRYSGAHPDGDPSGSEMVFNIPAPIEGPFGDKYFEKRIIPGGGGLTISASSKVPEVAMEWIDFVYASEEGFDLYAWGVEGVNYKIENGVKSFIPNPEEPDVSKAQLMIGSGQPPWAHVQSILAWRQIIPAWLFPLDELNQRYYIEPFPPIANTQEELDTINELFTDIDTYVKEMRMKFILGQEDIESEWDNYVNTLDRLGYKRLETVYQQMYDRYQDLVGN